MLWFPGKNMIIAGYGSTGTIAPISGTPAVIEITGFP